MKIFVAGARSITELDDDMQQRVNSICDKDNDIIVGDTMVLMPLYRSSARSAYTIRSRCMPATAKPGTMSETGL